MNTNLVGIFKKLGKLSELKTNNKDSIVESINELASRPSGTGGISEEEREKIDKSVSNVEATETYNTIKVTKNDGTYENVLIKIRESATKNDILNVFKTAQIEGSFTAQEKTNTFIVDGFDETKDLTLIHENLFLISEVDYILDKTSGTVTLSFSLEPQQSVHYIVTSTSYEYSELRGTPNLEVYALKENLEEVQQGVISLTEDLDSRGFSSSVKESSQNADDIVKTGYYTGVQGLPTHMTEEGKYPILSVIGTQNYILQKCFVINLQDKNYIEYSRLKIDVWGEWKEKTVGVSTQKTIVLQKGETHIQWKYTDEETWKDLIAIDELKGQDGEAGREIELRKGETAIQSRYVGEGEEAWKDVVALNELKGDRGEDADTSQFYTKQEIDEKTETLAEKVHTHTKEEISNFPTSLPANGGNADTVGGKHASDFATASHSHSDYASSSHSHIIANISDLQGELDGIKSSIKNVGGGVKSVQRGIFKTTYSSAGQSDKVISLSTVNPTKCSVTLNGGVTTSTGDYVGLPVVKGLEATKLTLEMAVLDFSESGRISWEVVEYA